MGVVFWDPQKQGIGNGTSYRPSLCVHKGLLYAAWKNAGSDHTMFWSTFDGETWTTQQQGPGGGTSHGPALCEYDGLLYAVWKGSGSDHRMFMSTFDGNQWATQQGGPDGGTSHGPALCEYDGLLYAAWKGSGDDQRMWWSTLNGNQWATQQQGIDSKLFGGGTSVGPTLCVFGTELMAAWKDIGDEQTMSWSLFDGEKWVTQDGQIAGGSSVGPSLVRTDFMPFDFEAYAAWKGSGDDTRMFYSRIEKPDIR